MGLNHSGWINARATTASQQKTARSETSPSDSILSKQSALWPAVSEKKVYKEFENKFCEALYKMTVSTVENLGKLAGSIYDIEREMFGVKNGTRLATGMCGPCKWVTRMFQLRKEEKSFRKQRIYADVDKILGLLQLYEDFKRQYHYVQQHIRRYERRRGSQRARNQFLKNLYGVAKRLLDAHIRETYDDPERHLSLPLV